MRFVILFALLLSVSHARDVTIAWDPNDPTEEVTEYRVYLEDKANPGTWNLLKTVPAAQTSIIITLPSGKQTIFLTAFNGLESDPSDSLSVPQKPNKVTGIVIPPQ